MPAARPVPSPRVPLPPQEAERLVALHGTGVLGTPPEPAFDEIVRLAAMLCQAPLAAVSLVDSRRQWFKARIGFPTGETAREDSFCTHAILSPAETLVVRDATQDPRFTQSSLVTGQPHVRFYAGAPLVNRAGQALGALCVADTEARDLSPQQGEVLQALARQVMREIENRTLVRELAEQRDALDDHALVAMVDRSGNVLHTNRYLQQATGLAEASLAGAPGGVRAPAHPLHFLFGPAWDALARGRRWQGEVTSRTAAGHPVWLQALLMPMKDGGGQARQYLAIATDITEARQARMERAERAEQLKLLGSALAQAGDAIVVTDADLDRSVPRIVFVNAAFTAMTGFSSEEAIGQTPLIARGERTDRHVLFQLREALLRGEPFRAETVNYRKDGSTFDAEWQVTPVRDAHGIVTNFVTVFRDMTARKAAELELARAREDALESARLKSRFLANMSHELRTPLNTINGLSATLVEQDLPAPAKDAIRLILQCGETLLDNIQTILTHSTLEAGKAKLDTKPVTLAHVVLNALRIAAPAAQRKGLRLGYDLDPRTPAQLLGDPFRLQQVFVNLLSNAIKFTDAGRVYLRLRSHELPDGTWDLRVAVADTGIGIAADGLRRLFQPFSQADTSTTRRFEGTGLGLAITKSIVELMHGRVSVRSRPGRGSIFLVRLRLPAIGGTSSIFAEGAPPDLKNLRALILEPDPMNVRQLRGMLEAWGLQVSEARNALDGVTRAGRDRFDFILRRFMPSAGAFNPFASTQGASVIWLAGPGECPPAATAGRHATLMFPWSAADMGQALATARRGEPVAAAIEPSRAPARKLGDRIPLRILAADDIHTNREMLTYICRHLGYKTEMAVNGAEVLERLAQASYDLILLDVQMPVLDGLSAAREICRRYPDLAKRPRLVAVTASVQPGDRECCLAAGMDAYLCKPLLPGNLQACIEALFGRKDSVPSAGATNSSLAVNLPSPWVDVFHLRATTHGLDDLTAVSLITQIYAAAQTDLAALRPRLAQACASHHEAEAATLLHGMKGCVLALGWARMGLHCAETLHALREGRFNDWDNLAGELDELQRHSSAAMERILPELFAGPTRNAA